MTDVIDFLFSTLGNVWTVILSSWILSFSFAVTLIGFVVSLYLGSREE